MSQIRRGEARGASRESFWRQMMRRQAKSRLSIRSWCQRHGLAEATFYWWRKELSRRDAELAGGASFVRVRVVEDESPPDSAIEIMLSGQQRVRVIGRVDRQSLADVLWVLTSAKSVEGQAC